jgi:ABC-type phosphate/phosphonate transport system permease subunit
VLAAEIRDTPQDEAWRDMGAEDLGELWYGSYPPMLHAYLPGARLEWRRLRCRGDAVNELEARNAT